jgi:hypothetical protein
LLWHKEFLPGAAAFEKDFFGVGFLAVTGAVAGSAAILLGSSASFSS